jgi:hypothetical protein
MVPLTTEKGAADMRATGRSELTRAELSARIDTLGWGALFVALGASARTDLPKDAWLIAAGVVMVGVSATRACGCRSAA